MINKKDSKYLMEKSDVASGIGSTAMIISKMFDELDLKLSEPEKLAVDFLKEVYSDYRLKNYQQAVLTQKIVAEKFDAGKSQVIGAVIWALTPVSGSNYPPSYALGISLYNLAEITGVDQVVNVLDRVCAHQRLE